MFFEYFGNIDLSLLEFAKKGSTFIIVRSYTFNTITTFPSKTFLKLFSFNMFPKCSPDTRNIAMLREHSANIPGILPAGWGSTGLFMDWKLQIYLSYLSIRYPWCLPFYRIVTDSIIWVSGCYIIFINFIIICIQIYLYWHYLLCKCN